MKQFFQDASGHLSMMRLISLILVLAGIVYAFVNKDIIISSMLITFGVGGKLGQKFQK